MPPISAGGTVTITRFADHVSSPARTATRPPLVPIDFTGRLSFTAPPSRFASSSEIRCEPPTIRFSWAPPVVLIRLLKSAPAIAV